MSEHASNFLAHLQQLRERDRGALARLRRSLAQAPGTDPRTYPFVEPFVGADWHALDSRRLALHLGAGLFALNPHHGEHRSLAEAFGALARERDSGSLELRFMALLGADAGLFPSLIRQIVNLLEGQAYDQTRLLEDLQVWLSSSASDRRDRIRQQWARDFYRHFTPPATPTPSEEKP